MGSKALYFIALVVTLCAIATISHANSIDDNSLISSLTSAPTFIDAVSPEDAAKDTLTIPMATEPSSVEPSLVAMSSTYGIKSFRKGPYATKWPWLAFGAEGSDDDEYPYYYKFADGTWVKVLSRWRYIEKEPHPRAKNILTEEARMFQIKKERLRLKNVRLGFGDDDPDEDEEAYDDYDPNDVGVLVEPTNEKVDKKDLKAALHHPDPLVKKLAKWHKKVARHQKRILKLTRKARLAVKGRKGRKGRKSRKSRKGRKSRKSRKARKSKKSRKSSKKSKKRGLLKRFSKFARKTAKKVGKAAKKMFRGKSKKSRKSRKARKARKHGKKARKRATKSRKHGKKSRKGRKSKKSSKKLKKSVKKAFKKALKKPLKAFKKAVNKTSSAQPGRGFKPKRGPPPPTPFVPMTDASYLKHLNQAVLPDDLPEFHIDDHPSALAPQFDRIRRDVIGIHNRVEYARDLYQ